VNEVVNQQENRPPSPIVQFKRDMEAMVVRELDMLDDKAKSRMKSAAIVAVTKDPDLLMADRQSFMGAIRMCAQHGVTPDGNEATLQVYNTKVKLPDGREQWVKKVTYLPMVRGIVNRVERSGKIKPFYAEVVYEGEAFSIDTSHGDRRPVHAYDPMRRGADEDIIGAYSVARYVDGVVDCEPMPRAEIEKVKASAKTKNVWDGWFSEKAKVAVMKRHSKRLPLSAEDMDFILNRDETDFDQPRDITPPAAKPNLAQRLASNSVEKINMPAETVGRAEGVQEAEVADGPSQAANPPEAAPDAPYRALAANGAPNGDAWTKGATAFHEGKPITSCPYDPDEAKADAEDWCGGWCGAELARS